MIAILHTILTSVLDIVSRSGAAVRVSSAVESGHDPKQLDLDILGISAEAFRSVGR